jgi:hypothetical protein
MNVQDALRMINGAKSVVSQTPNQKIYECYVDNGCNLSIVGAQIRASEVTSLNGKLISFSAAFQISFPINMKGSEKADYVDHKYEILKEAFV